MHGARILKPQPPCTVPDPARRCAGPPFLMHCEAAWSLIAQLCRDEVDVYLQDRKTQRLDAIL